ncbi:extracellular solute-binding protein [Paracoccus litorisediminis]|uniref:Extracellular solute-binding protein n=1 Tax=Paracoccus litorisediminis TaxID=2006130 RepID=A0A844HXE4_9RHOB|nr:extracellular solute-binding protein [Paracoccus litorisediminis]MTH62171.1 extracellular solute-binding protein [Paracoccus litorisediminis]
MTKHTTRRKFLSGTVAGLAAMPILMSASGRALAADQQLIFWSQLAGSKKTAGEELEKAFTAAHPEITLSSSLYAEPSQLNEKMLTAINGNTGPDLIVQHWDYNLIYASGGKLADLGKGLSGVDVAAYDPSLLAYGRQGDTLFSMPLYGTSRGLGLNRKLLSEAGLNPDIGPKNWAELRQWAKAATKRNGPMLQAAGFQLFQNDLEAFELFTLLLQGAGGSLLSADLTSASFAGPEGVKALTFIQQLVYEDKATDPGFAFGPGGMSNPFNQGRSALTIAGNYSTNNALKGGIDFDVLPIPKENGGFTSLVDPFCFGVRAGAENEAAAMKFIEFAISPENQVAFALASKNVPALKAAQQDAAVQADKYLAKFVETASYAPPTAPATPVFSRMMTLVARGVQEVVYGKSTPETALKAASDEVASLLLKRS